MGGQERQTHPPEVTKGVALALLLGAPPGGPPRQMLLAALMLLGRLSPAEVALEAEVVAVEKVAAGCRAEALSTLACCGPKTQRL